MTRSDANTLGYFVAGAGALLALGALALSGGRTGAGVAVGALIALVNWHLIAWVVGRVIDARAQSKGGLMVLLGFKLLALMGAVYVLLQSGLVPALPLLVGLSSLALGGIVGAAFIATARRPSHATGEGR
jgi:hypothetical protein